MPRNVAFVLSPDFSNLGLALAIETLFVGNWLAQEKVFDWQVISADGAAVRASNHMVVPVDGALPAEVAFDTVFVLASFNPKHHAKDRRITNWLRRVARFGVEIGGIETGSEFLAAAGLLNGHIAAVHWDNLEGFQERYPEVEAKPTLYNLDRGRLTCGGATAIADMLLHWMSLLGYAQLAEEIAQHLLIGGIRAGNQVQGALDNRESDKSEDDGQIVKRTLAIMRDAIEEPLSCGEIARMVGLSQRQLQRHFQVHLQSTLTREYTRIRLAKAHQLLQQTDLLVTEVAVGSGFASLENFSRVYRNVFGCSPSKDRRQTTSAPVFRPRGVNAPSGRGGADQQQKPSKRSPITQPSRR